ncbi:MAG: RICIN domain-containing protein [Sedimentisphaerales bacterium]|nr:RICIN domain-containing protein [Sedimentisphaerales bacterium]
MLASSVVYSATSASISFNYNNTSGALDKPKLLNLARGNKGPIWQSSWHNSFYGNMATVGIRELRLDWLPDDTIYHVVSRNGGNLVYDWTALDAVLMPLLKKGMRPLMCMNMADVDALGISSSNHYPSNMDDYAAVITAFVQHYKNLGYTGLVWESHNEPEYFATDLTPEEVYAMYDRFAPAVKAADPTAIVGGYGSGPDHWTFMGDFLDAYNGDTSKPPMDFFSYHKYGEEDFSTVSTVVDLFTNRGLTPPPLYMTEWNDYPFVQTDNDTSAHASWVSKKFYRAMMHYPQLGRIYFFNYADGDTSKVFNGDNGLFTAGNHKKASANAFNMYNNLHGAILTPTISGTDTSSYNVYSIATKDPATGAVSLIIWNNRSTDLNASLQVSNLPYLSAGQNFVLTKYVIDEDDGNYYYDYLYNGAQPGDTAVGQSENVGVAEITTYSPAGSLSRSEYLPAWSVTTIKLEPVSIFDPDTCYELVNCNSGLVLQINGASQAEQGSYQGAANQEWLIVDLGGGWYKIVNTNNGRVLEVPGGSMSQGTRLADAVWTGADHQKWSFVNLGSYYKILNKNSGMCINVSGASQNEGGWVVQWSFVSGLNEHWKVQTARPAPNETCRGHWKLDESIGTLAADASGFDEHGTLSGTNFSTSSVSGKYNRALSFDGVDDHITIPALDLYSNTVTITAWVQIDSTPVPWSGIFFTRSPNANGLNIGNTGSGAELRYHWNNTMYSWISGLSLSANVCTFVALVIEPDKGTIYMDSGSGFQSATHYATHDPAAFRDISYIGYDPQMTSRHFEGVIDDVRVYNASLTPEELALVRDNTQPDPMPPAAPTGLSASIYDGAINLDWNDNTEPDFNSYNVYRGTTVEGPYTKIDTNVPGSYYADSTFADDTKYYYIVTAVDDSQNESDDSSYTSTIHFSGDLSFDGFVDMFDMAELGAGWQSIYDINNLAKLSETWLSETYLIAHLPLDGDANDVSWNQFEGVCYGDVSWSSSGYIGGAAEFDGSGSYIKFPGFDGITGTGSRTCTAWIKTGVNQCHILTWGTAGSGTAWKIQTTVLGKLQVDVGDGDIKGNTTVINNTWHHIAVVLADDGSPNVDEVLLYVDGQPQTTSGTSQAIDTAAGGDVRLGSFSSDPLYFNGLIDEVRIYDRALSVEEIEKLAE